MNACSLNCSLNGRLCLHLPSCHPLFGIVWYCMVFAWYCMVLLVLYGIEKPCLHLPSCHPLPLLPSSTESSLFQSNVYTSCCRCAKEPEKIKIHSHVIILTPQIHCELRENIALIYFPMQARHQGFCQIVYSHEGPRAKRKPLRCAPASFVIPSVQMNAGNERTPTSLYALPTALG